MDTDRRITIAEIIETVTRWPEEQDGAYRLATLKATIDMLVRRVMPHPVRDYKPYVDPPGKACSWCGLPVMDVVHDPRRAWTRLDPVFVATSDQVMRDGREKGKKR